MKMSEIIPGGVYGVRFYGRTGTPQEVLVLEVGEYEDTVYSKGSFRGRNVTKKGARVTTTNRDGEWVSTIQVEMRDHDAEKVRDEAYARAVQAAKDYDLPMPEQDNSFIMKQATKDCTEWIELAKVVCTKAQMDADREQAQKSQAAAAEAKKIVDQQRPKVRDALEIAGIKVYVSDYKDDVTLSYQQVLDLVEHYKNQ